MGASDPKLIQAVGPKWRQQRMGKGKKKNWRRQKKMTMKERKKSFIIHHMCKWRVGGRGLEMWEKESCMRRLWWEIWTRVLRLSCISPVWLRLQPRSQLTSPAPKRSSSFCRILHDWQSPPTWGFRLWLRNLQDAMFKSVEGEKKNWKKRRKKEVHCVRNETLTNWQRDLSSRCGSKGFCDNYTETLLHGSTLMVGKAWKSSGTHWCAGWRKSHGGRLRFPWRFRLYQ